MCSFQNKSFSSIFEHNHIIMCSVWQKLMVIADSTSKQFYSSSLDCSVMTSAFGCSVLKSFLDFILVSPSRFCAILVFWTSLKFQTLSRSIQYLVFRIKYGSELQKCYLDTGVDQTTIVWHAPYTFHSSVFCPPKAALSL